MKITLLEKAKKIPCNYLQRGDASYEETEVVIAFVKKELNWGQLIKTVPNIFGKSTNYGRIVKIIRDGIEKGWVNIAFKKEK